MTTKKFLSGLLMSSALVSFTPISWSMEQTPVSPINQTSFPEVVESTIASTIETFKNAVLEEANNAQDLYPPSLFVKNKYNVFIRKFFTDFRNKEEEICMTTVAAVKEELADKVNAQKDVWISYKVEEFEQAFKARDISLLKVLTKQEGEEIVTAWLGNLEIDLKPFQKSIVEGILLGFAANEVKDLTPAFSALNVPPLKKETLIQTRADIFAKVVDRADEDFAHVLITLQDCTKEELGKGFSQFYQLRAANTLKFLSGTNLTNKKKEIDIGLRSFLTALAGFGAGNVPFSKLTEARQILDAVLLPVEE
ncbi:MAG: hypothetical protein LBH38_03490 [Holosporales bacterium]|nr:hypothetical protein [Holosporales bacterium]